MFERLTHRDSKGDVWIKDAAHVDEQGQICMLSERLAAYEDIGMTPEEIIDMIYRFEAFLSAMTGGRMSKSNYTLDAMISAADEYQQSLCDECWDRSELDKYHELEREGRLVVLPLKVGSTIYRPEAPQYSWEIVSATIYLDETIFTDDSDNIIKETDIGKTVFLTREEAEKALGGETERGKEG